MTPTTTLLDADRLALLRDRLGHRDWREVTVAEIAEAVGVSRMTLHRHGVGKDDVLVALGQLLETEFREAALPALAAAGSARERLRGALAAICAIDERYLGVFAALSTALEQVFHERGDGAVLTREPFTGVLARLLEAGARDGSIPPQDDPAETATLLFNAAGHTYRHLRTGHRWPAEKARERVVALVVDGLGPGR
ncbi:MAG TPA: TetR/AcrR family transcriptional regulator [Baekduia sp.]|uniref:TetR/AcrR family transcriptional regulator n=1 Tax=Baekduia sp. TaxID=2600305 RepID=UPI002D76CEC2|nr:TetR/AcrR family transcriptional regulator [Baekduia sp.]HET6506586.1 TetR/AcrR family transcriptional regulator [Baekduia sp.]